MAINILEEKLVAVRNQKKAYEKQCKVLAKERDEAELYCLSQKIRLLDKEEHELLKEINRGR